jgi:site-specific DNA-methyltransferase (adenine-specific)
MRNATQKDLFDSPIPSPPQQNGQTRETLGRIDADPALHKKLLDYCRLGLGQIWHDPLKGHRVGVLDATNTEHVLRIVEDDRPSLLVNDPPYNVAVGNANTNNLSKMDLATYMIFSRRWVENCIRVMGVNAHFYVWLGADVRDNFQPLPDFMIMMREFPQLTPRNFITLRNQRGYGTQKNWMWVRQELLHYIRGNPDFTVQYTDIPKVLRGYYKNVNGKLTENLERSKSDKIRPGNVWVDVQQVFYRMEENVPGCYAQKPLKAIERLLLSSSQEGDCVLDCFSHSATTLIAGERLNRRVVTFDIDPVFAELTIRRLENYRKTGRTGWQWHNPFPEMEAVYDAATAT